MAAYLNCSTDVVYDVGLYRGEEEGGKLREFTVSREYAECIDLPLLDLSVVTF